MMDTTHTMVLASFVADSLALGAHWIYDTQKIVDLFGRVDRLLKPSADSYHPTKEKGDFTHYGDQTLVLLESLAENRAFDLNDFSRRWRALFSRYTGYFDQATRMTLAGYRQGKTAEAAGSPSDELAGAARIAPLVYLYREDIDKLVESARSQTRMTHTDPLTVESAEFFARTACRVLAGTAPIQAMERVSAEGFGSSLLSDWVKKGIESKDMDSVSVISRLGQSCHTREAFAGVVHLIAKYENDPGEALIQSVMAGGDGAARGMMVGMVLGAHPGPKSLPEEWISGMRKKARILQLLQKI
jgi:ADP-ribosylglycohydrolase